MAKAKVPLLYSVTEARERFADILNEVEKGRTVVLMRYGKPVVACVSAMDYQLIAREGKKNGR